MGEPYPYITIDRLKTLLDRLSRTKPLPLFYAGGARQVAADLIFHELARWTDEGPGKAGWELEVLCGAAPTNPNELLELLSALASARRLLAKTEHEARYMIGSLPYNDPRTGKLLVRAVRLREDSMGHTHAADTVILALTDGSVAPPVGAIYVLQSQVPE